MKEKIFNGDLIAKPGVVYDYTHITGSIDARGADTKTAFPKLTSVGGSIDASGYFNNVKIDPDLCREALMASFARSGYSFADGVLSEIIQQKGRVSRVRVCGQVEISCLVTDGNSWSRGKTLKEARDGLMFKISSRDTTKFRAWNLDMIVSKSEAIQAYRVITGACEAGVRAWMSQRNTPDKIKVKDIIKITEGSYRHEAFMKFFTEVK